MVKSLGDLIKEALAEPVTVPVIQGPRIEGLNMADLICRVIYEKQLDCGNMEKTDVWS